MKRKITQLILIGLSLLFTFSASALVPYEYEVRYLPYTEVKIESYSNIQITSTSTQSTYSSIESEIFRLINDHRLKMGLRALRTHDYLSDIAEGHVDYMIQKNLVSHDGFPTRYSKIMNTLKAQAVGENVAYGYSSAGSVVAAWINSYSHRRNIEGNWSHFGVSAKRHPSTGRLYFTMMFTRI